jgi:hypothetical protein
MTYNSHPQRPHHHHQEVKAHQVLVEIGPEEYVPFAEGVAKPSHIVLLWLLFAFIWLAAVGLLIWFAVVISQESPFYCPDATTKTSGNYVVYQKRAAEPYCGTPASVSLNVTEADTCQTICTNDSNCLFFTYDQSHNKCYFYETGVLPLQNITAAVPGPTSLFSDVYVKNNGRVVQLRGALVDG